MTTSPNPQPEPTDEQTDMGAWLRARSPRRTEPTDTEPADSADEWLRSRPTNA